MVSTRRARPNEGCCANVYGNSQQREEQLNVYCIKNTDLPILFNVLKTIKAAIKNAVIFYSSRVSGPIRNDSALLKKKIKK